LTGPTGPTGPTGAQGDPGTVSWKDPVRLRAVGNVNLATELEAGDTIDGKTLVAGDLVLCDRQTTGTQDGVYVASVSGAASRSSQWPLSSHAGNWVVFVQDGDTYVDKAYVCTNNYGSDVIGTDGLVFAQLADIGPTGPTGANGPTGPTGPTGANGTFSRSFIITNPTALSDGPIWRVPIAITITAIHVLCMDGTNIVGQLWEYDSNGANGATVDSSDITGTAGTNVNDDGFLSNPSIAAGNYLGWKTTSVSGAVTKVIVTFEYTVD
jgi:hypothetical protein